MFVSCPYEKDIYTVDSLGEDKNRLTTSEFGREKTNQKYFLSAQTNNKSKSHFISFTSAIYLVFILQIFPCEGSILCTSVLN